jgi:hypothetical protein
VRHENYSGRQSSSHEKRREIFTEFFHSLPNAKCDATALLGGVVGCLMCEGKVGIHGLFGILIIAVNQRCACLPNTKHHLNPYSI